ncbi:hypothetical protein BPT24_149 [Tenacibaculum phage pT24]|uniref:Uncharacterized protein n=1 Tax=Tenacibaculum phage pT24 TaxID=1880590 RepID=A0A1B4XWU8_9CAUD|nr:hypothetical protein HYP10_gp149 [Tenacibaculum phage pT24]BAV39275.1 hypothetical protein BPT24_149 [Tenacibaculum phage pT24]
MALNTQGFRASLNSIFETASKNAISSYFSPKVSLKNSSVSDISNASSNGFANEFVKFSNDFSNELLSYTQTGVVTTSNGATKSLPFNAQGLANQLIGGLTIDLIYIMNNRLLGVPNTFEKGNYTLMSNFIETFSKFVSASLINGGFISVSSTNVYVNVENIFRETFYEAFSELVRPEPSAKNMSLEQTYEISINRFVTPFSLIGDRLAPAFETILKSSSVATSLGVGKIS